MPFHDMSYAKPHYLKVQDTCTFHAVSNGLTRGTRAKRPSVSFQKTFRAPWRSQILLSPSSSRSLLRARPGIRPLSCLRCGHGGQRERERRVTGEMSRRRLSRAATHSHVAARRCLEDAATKKDTSPRKQAPPRSRCHVCRYPSVCRTVARDDTLGWENTAKRFACLPAVVIAPFPDCVACMLAHSASSTLNLGTLKSLTPRLS